MKTFNQVNKYLIPFEMSSEVYAEVVDFLSQYDINKPVRRYGGKVPFDFKQFKTWFKEGPGVGDLVRYGSIVCVVADCKPDHLLFSAHFGLDDKLTDLQGKFYKSQRTECKVLSGEERRVYEEKIHNEGLTIASTGMLVKVPLAKKGRMYQFLYEGENWYGVVRNRDTASVTMAFAYNKKRIIEEDLVVDSKNMIRELSNKEEEEMQEDMYNALSCRWSSFGGMILYRCKRVPKNTRYYYLNDKFGVTSVVDNYGKVHDMRYENGNYFLTMEEATAFVIHVRKYCSDKIKTGLSVTDRPVK